MTTGDYEPDPVTHEPIRKYRDFSEASIDYWCEACKDFVSSDHLALRTQQEYENKPRRDRD